MDPNLYFRIAIPAWSGLIAAGIMVLASGGPWPARIASELGKNDVATVAVALLGAPSIGFLLNAFVIAFCETVHVGPVYSSLFQDFKDDVLNALSDNEPRKRIRESVARAQPAAVVAHFEYRADTSVLLDWRRRQRTAFFANWSNVVAITLGTALTYPVWLSAISRGPRPWLGFAINAAVALVLAFIAQRSKRISDDQQRIWANSLDQGDIRVFLDGKGSGLSDHSGDK